MSAGSITGCDVVADQPRLTWPLQPGQAFDFLLGDWDFERQVPQQATMRGQATVSLYPDGTALYHEVARIQLLCGEGLGRPAPSAAALRGERRYLYVRSRHGVDICFYPEKGLFQRLDFATHKGGGLFASAQHLCKQDVYRSAYELLDSDSFRVMHRVSGPRKDYEIETLYRRRSAGAL